MPITASIMANPTPVPLLGRLAVQLKLVTKDKLAVAMQNAAGAGNAGLGEVMVEMGLINIKQLQKLEQVQQDVIAKHRAKKAAAAGGGAAAPAKPEPVAAPTPPAADPVHAVASQATRETAPISGDEVLELAEPAPAADPILELAEPAGAPDPILELAEPAGAPDPVVELAEPAAAPQTAPQPPAQPTGPRIEIEGDPGLELSLPVPDAAHQEHLQSLLGAAVQAGASDVHFHANGRVQWRIGGELIAQGDAPIDPATSEALVAAALNASEQQSIMREGEIDYCLELPGVGRFRANSYRQQRGFDSVYRVVSAEPPTLESLGLPAELKRFTTYHQGMVLITGPAGCGKSATMAALVNLINEEREEHILCIEDPIEILHPSKKCLVNQRHAGRHTESFARALRGALREDPDVIVIGELRDLETISLAMTAAETGHFVLATLHTNNAVRTINRMIGAFPASEQGQIRTMLSESLRAVISQRLVPRADGQGRVPALELLVLNKAISNLVRDEKTVQIRSSIQTGKAHGMYLLEQSLSDLVQEGVISRETALRFAEDEKLITAK